MKNKNIAVGLLLVLLGTFWMLENLGFITWSIWEGISDLWPLILVVIGINIIFKHKTVVSIIMWLLFFMILVVYGFFQQSQYENLESVKSSIVQIEKKSALENGELDLDLGGGNLIIASTKEFLVDAKVSNPYVKNRVDYHDGQKSAVVQFKENNYGTIRIKNSWDYDFLLDENLLWNLDIDMGAANGTIDLSELKFQNLDMDMGAGNLKIMFGDKIEDADVKIDTGASNIDLVIPKDMGVKIKVDSAVKDTNLKSLNWDIQQGYYRSPNYDSASKRIHVDIDMGVGKLDVVLK